MIYEKYNAMKHVLTWPDRNRCIQEAFVGIDDFIGNMKALKEENQRREELGLQMYRDAKNAYNEKIHEIDSAFEAELAEIYCTLPAQAAKAIFAKAWEDGHSSGYSEIENKYIDLCDFAEKLFD